MDDFPITKKAKRPWWIWAALAAIILLGLFLAFGDRVQPDPAPPAEIETAP